MNSCKASLLFSRAYELDSIDHAELVVDRYYKWFNTERRHGSLKGNTPDEIWNRYFIPFTWDY